MSTKSPEFSKQMTGIPVEDSLVNEAIVWDKGTSYLDKKVAFKLKK